MIGKFHNSIVRNAGVSAVVVSGCSFEYSAAKGLSGSTNIPNDPQLDKNYSLQTGATASPCIDTGKATTETVIDINGNPRPDTTGKKIVDMGAFEVK